MRIAHDHAGRDASRMKVIGIAGLPGSGKSTLLRELVAAGFVAYDDFGERWDEHTAQARADLASGKSVVVSEINFCQREWRTRVEDAIGQPVEWIFFANDPWQCAVNCLYRLMVQLDERPIMEMLQEIAKLSPSYLPDGEPIAIHIADSAIRRER